MTRAFIYLRLTSFINYILSTVKRLKEPKFILGTAAAFLYLYYVVFRTMGGEVVNSKHLPVSYQNSLTIETYTRDQFLGVGACILFLLTIVRVGWLLVSPPKQVGLKFSDAEIAFLFPAPLTRKKLIHFNLLSAQITVLISSVILTLVFGRGNVGFVLNIYRTLGWWVILSAMNLFSIGSGLFVTRTLERVSKPLVAKIVTGLLLIVLVKFAFSSFLNAPLLESVASGSITSILAHANAFIKVGTFRWLFLPFSILVTPYFSTHWNTFIFGIAQALVVLAILYCWILNMEVSFEDASLARAENRAAIRAAVAAGKPPINASTPNKVFKDPFRLSSYGSPEIAFLWKNLISIQSWFNLRLILLMFGPALASGFYAIHESGKELDGAKLILIISSVVAMVTLLVGPQFLRQDLRSDIVYMDMLKTYPLKGWQIVLGEIITPVFVMTSCLLLSLGLCVFSSTKHPQSVYSAFSVILTGILVIPPVCTLQLIIPNAAALIFPALAMSANNRRGGIEVVGQRLIFILGQIFAIICALIPALILGLLVYISAHWWAGLFFMDQLAKCIGAFAGAGTAMLLMVGEIALGLWWLGYRFEKFDISKDLPQGSL